MTRRNRRLLTIPLSCSLALAACADSPTDEASPDASAPTAESSSDHGSLFGAVRRSTLWTKSTLSVCFVARSQPFRDHTEEESADIEAHSRAWIQDAVQRTWGQDTRFSFVWQPGHCSGPGAADITIAQTSSVSYLGFSKYGTLAIGSYPSMEINMPCELPPQTCVGPGHDDDGVSSGPPINHDPFGGGMPNKCTVVPGQPRPTDMESCVRITAIHEFGHALGLMHEHERLDTPTTCPFKGTGIDLTGLWSYDPMSKMNYCAPDLWTKQSLSPGDLRAISTLYSPQVIAYSASSYGGSKQVFGPGVYNAGVSAASLVIAPGLVVKACNGANQCATYTESTPTLPASTVRLEIDARVWAFEHNGYQGRNTQYASGVHMGHDIDLVCNDCISSVIVPAGLDARLCWHEAGGVGSVCTSMPGGPEYDTFYDHMPSGFNDQTSFVEATPRAVLYRDRDFVGGGKSFAIGSKTSNPLAGASSLVILPGSAAKVCTSVGAGSGGGTCQTFTSSGNLPAALDNNVAYLETWYPPVAVPFPTR